MQSRYCRLKRSYSYSSSAAWHVDDMFDSAPSNRTLANFCLEVVFNFATARVKKQTRDEP